MGDRIKEAVDNLVAVKQEGGTISSAQVYSDLKDFVNAGDRLKILGLLETIWSVLYRKNKITLEEFMGYLDSYLR